MPPLPIVARLLRWMPVLLLAALAGCASPGRTPTPGGGTLAERCARVLAAIDAVVDAAGTGDAEGSRVDGFAYLRTNRLLASFRDGVRPMPPDAPAWREWVDAMRRLDLEARIAEIANLDPAATKAVHAALQAEGLGALPPAAVFEGCGAALRNRDLADPHALERLRAAAAVPDDYDTWKRVVGLYALTRVPFAAGVRRWQDETRATFAVPLSHQPVAGALRRHALAGARPRALPAAAVAAQLAAARAGSALGLHDERALLALAPAFAPVFEVDEASPADRIGSPSIGADGLPTADPSKPAIFVRATQTRYLDQVLPQLVYTVWFSARPKAGPLDLLGGRLDAVVWRVTLAVDGEAVLFDTMHGCGCYHLFFPTARAVLRPPPDEIDEHAFVPSPAPMARLAAGERVVVRLANGTHYVSGIAVTSAWPADMQTLPPADDTSLRRLPLPDGRTRSLYGPDGLVAGSERGERYLFWPMGIAEPGAMRQWGRHATAFVGRRHFDDADLVPRHFMILPPP